MLTTLMFSILMFTAKSEHAFLSDVYKQRDDMHLLTTLKNVCLQLRCSRHRKESTDLI